MRSQSIDRYIVMSHSLGSGSFAMVHLAMDTSAFKQVACKCIKRKPGDKIEKIKKEVDILLNLSHVREMVSYAHASMHTTHVFTAKYQYSSCSNERRKLSVRTTPPFGVSCWLWSLLVTYFWNSALAAIFSRTSSVVRTHSYARPKQNTSCISCWKDWSICTTDWFPIEVHLL